MEWTESLHWGWRRRLPVIRQTEAAECGLACLAMVADWHGYRIDLSRLRNQFSVTLHGMAFVRLMECAETLHLSPRAVRLELEELSQLPTPCILHWDRNHFVVLKRVRGQKVELHDPARGEVCMTLAQIDRHFTGIALELTPDHAFKKLDLRKKVKLTALIGHTVGLKTALIKIFCFSLSLELLALLSPLINQVVIDEVLVALDDSLLVLIIIAMLLMTATQTLIGLARQWAAITMSVNFNMQWTANVFHHLLRLPIDWFEKRDIGNISAKFDAVDSIQSTLTTTILEALLDVLLVVGTLSMMLLYNVPLSLMAIAAALLYCLMRILWFSAMRQAAEDSWLAGTLESSHFLETLHGMLSLRVNGALIHRESSWRNLNVARRNTQLKEDKLAMVYGIINTVIGSLLGAGVLWYGAQAVLSGQFSVGMLVAFLSFQGRFSGSINNIIDTVFAWRMLDVYNERLADIVLTPREDTTGIMNTAIVPALRDGEPALILQDVSFRYAPDEREILSNVSLLVMPGEVVALTGRSGCGKTTLAKLVLGLYTPTSGEIRTLGLIHHQPGYSSVRKMIGAVLQEDQLFRGSILDNICFFSPHADQESAQQCAELAQLHDDIIALPMGYFTQIGEMGCSLSGGQKQRLLLARALYKKPQMLIMDEATSQLDVGNEIIISQALRELGVSILLIAHRPETIASADRVIELNSGKLLAKINITPGI